MFVYTIYTSLKINNKRKLFPVAELFPARSCQLFSSQYLCRLCYALSVGSLSPLSRSSTAACRLLRARVDFGLRCRRLRDMRSAIFQRITTLDDGTPRALSTSLPYTVLILTRVLLRPLISSGSVGSARRRVLVALCVDVRSLPASDALLSSSEGAASYKFLLAHYKLSSSRCVCVCVCT